MKSLLTTSPHIIFAALFMLSACATKQPGPAPTSDIPSIETVIARTSEAAATQTAFMISNPAVPTELPTATSTPEAGTMLFSEMDGATLLYVPAGEFLMGSIDADELAHHQERPQFPVRLEAFWIDQTEVTNKQYVRCVIAGGCLPPTNYSSFSRPAYYEIAEFENYPVLYVDWNRAAAYCAWAGRRLPTEAEWEKAARGTDGRIYPWGNEEPTMDKLNSSFLDTLDLQLDVLDLGDTTQVGSYEAGKSFYGAYDMAGNVFEWTSSLFRPYPYDAGDGREDTSISTEARVLRGGSWLYTSVAARAAFRDGNQPTDNYHHIGFRCAFSPLVLK
jgi:eukaryotic-like serine/threonine-protein kinase